MVAPLPEVLAEQLVGAVDEVDVHERRAWHTAAQAATVVVVTASVAVVGVT